MGQARPALWLFWAVSRRFSVRLPQCEVRADRKCLPTGRFLSGAPTVAAYAAAAEPLRSCPPRGAARAAAARRDGSDSGFIRALLHELGREEGVGHGVRAPRRWDHQADFLVGPSPLRVQLAVVAERDLAGDNAGVWLPNAHHKCQSPERAGGTRSPSALRALGSFLVKPAAPGQGRRHWP